MNPPTQYFNFLLPSQIAYSYLDFPISRPKLTLWHLGMNNVTEVHEKFLIQNKHAQLLDHASRTRYQSYVDIDLIADQYKQGRYYYTGGLSLTYEDPNLRVNKSYLCFLMHLSAFKRTLLGLKF